LKFLHLAHDEN
jgi:hypothetical protein